MIDTPEIKLVLQVTEDIVRVLRENAGEYWWRTCSGCHESNEGHPTGPFSETFQCHLGGGCHECGGIGATWESLPSPEECETMGKTS